MHGYEPIAPERASHDGWEKRGEDSPLDRFQFDDWLLLGLLFLLWKEDSCEDNSILLILAVLFLTGLE